MRKKYYSIDEKLHIQIIGMLASMLIPILGPLWYGTQFTSRFYYTRIANGIWVIIMFVIHISILAIYFL